ncbi:MAG: hypothetical protein BMS9Abin05_2088 [Rhodothermia bacterium]|nr:MAG: hypothetical protein BMS9Abin05_2088 [Rhodothermia bacterium]
MAQGDFNNDGRPDLVIARHDGQNMLLINSTVGAGNWVKIQLQGTNVNRTAIGTRIEVVAGGNTYIRYVSGGDSFASQSSSTMHVGLGSATVIDTLRIHWSAGSIE